MLPEFGQFHTNTLFFTHATFFLAVIGPVAAKRGVGAAPTHWLKVRRVRREGTGYPPPEVGDWLSVRGIREGTRHLR